MPPQELTGGLHWIFWKDRHRRFWCLRSMASRSKHYNAAGKKRDADNSLVLRPPTRSTLQSGSANDLRQTIQVAIATRCCNRVLAEVEALPEQKPLLLRACRCWVPRFAQSWKQRCEGSDPKQAEDTTIACHNWHCQKNKAISFFCRKFLVGGGHSASRFNLWFQRMVHVA